jgi:hypothetical protein
MRNRIFYFAFAAIASYAWLGWLESGGLFANIACQRPIQYAVVAATLVGVLCGLTFALKNSSIGGAIIGSIVSLVVSIAVSIALLSAFGSNETVLSSLCDNCSELSKFTNRLERVESQMDSDERADGYRKLEASIDDFIEGEMDRESKFADDVPDIARPQLCLVDAELIKARVLLSRLTNNEIPKLRSFEPKNIEDATICSAAVTEANSILDIAEAYLVAHNGDSQQLQLVKTHRETLTELAAKCATPDDKSITYSETRKNQPNFEIDVKVIDSNGNFVPAMEKLIEVWSNGQKIEAEVAQISGGAPLCLTVVADNSQSIIDTTVNPDGKKNLEYIAQSLKALNELRKPDDYYGLITFGGPNEITSVRNLDKSGVPTDKVDATGGNTAIWDAVKVGIEQLAECRYPKRMLLLLTDGEDNSSLFMKKTPKTPPADIVKALNGLANQNSVIMNVLAIGPAVENPDLKSFDTSDGAFLELNDFAGLSTRISEVVGAQENFYLVSIPLDKLEGMKLLKLKLKDGSSEVAVAVN